MRLRGERESVDISLAGVGSRYAAIFHLAGEVLISMRLAGVLAKGPQHEIEFVAR
jgi:hypothetical protein